MAREAASIGLPTVIKGASVSCSAGSVLNCSAAGKAVQARADARYRAKLAEASRPALTSAEARASTD
jgi:hypothetical protein